MHACSCNSAACRRCDCMQRCMRTCSSCPALPHLLASARREFVMFGAVSAVLVVCWSACMANVCALVCIDMLEQHDYITWTSIRNFADMHDFLLMHYHALRHRVSTFLNRHLLNDGAGSSCLRLLAQVCGKSRIVYGSQYLLQQSCIACHLCHCLARHWALSNEP